jgi:hypothetical protein
MVRRPDSHACDILTMRDGLIAGIRIDVAIERLDERDALT